MRRAGRTAITVGYKQKEKANYIILRVINEEYTKGGKLIRTARTFMTNVVEEMTVFLRAIEPAAQNEGKRYIVIVSEPSKWLGGIKNDQRYFEVQSCLKLLAEKEKTGIEIKREAE